MIGVLFKDLCIESEWPRNLFTGVRVQFAAIPVNESCVPLVGNIAGNRHLATLGLCVVCPSRISSVNGWRTEVELGDDCVESEARKSVENDNRLSETTPRHHSPSPCLLDRLGFSFRNDDDHEYTIHPQSRNPSRQDQLYLQNLLYGSCYDVSGTRPGFLLSLQRRVMHIV